MSSILYASEIVYFTKTDLDKLDAIQSGVARQLCQVNSSTASVSSLIATGLIPISGCVDVNLEVKDVLGGSDTIVSVSYTHLTLPTKRIV